MKLIYCLLIILSLLSQLGYSQGEQIPHQEEILLFKIDDNKDGNDSVKTRTLSDTAGKDNSVSFYSANGPDDLKQIHEIAEEGQYILIRKLAFMAGIKSLHHLQGKLAGYKKMEEMYDELGEIEAQRKEVYDSIVSYERNRGELFRTANDTLRMQIQELDSVFVEANKTTKQIITKRRKNSLGMGFLGAALGVATGLLIGIIGN